MHDIRALVLSGPRCTHTTLTRRLQAIRWYAKYREWRHIGMKNVVPIRVGYLQLLVVEEKAFSTMKNRILLGIWQPLV